jgi:hypothetical protein
MSVSIRINIANRDRLDPDSHVARRGRGTAPARAADWERSRPADREVRAGGMPDLARRTDPNNAPAAAHSSAANRSRILHSATPAGTLRVAERRPSERMAAQRRTVEAEQWEAAEVLRLDVAARLVRER